VEGIQDVPHKGNDGMRKCVERKVKKQMLVGCDVEALNYSGLSRSERKTKRLFDKRDD